MDHKEFASYIDRLISGGDLTRTEAHQCFRDILENRQTDMQQGAFLAAITAKQPTAAETAGIWQAIYELDTVKVSIQARQPLVENSGTGMDALKTFNISTAAALIAAADGVPIARHASRAITSSCGAVDILELLGVNVECPPETVKRSIELAGIGVFNGTSTRTHPKALARILSQISFGTVLNLAASLANPAQPKLAVRGVYHPDLLAPTAKAMREIGYQRALVVHGEGGPHTPGGIDEASTMGRTLIYELSPDGHIKHYHITPEQLAIKPARPADLAMGPDKPTEARRMKDLLTGRETRPRTDIACLNAGLILYVAGRQPTIAAGYRQALNLVNTKRPINKLIDWANVQS